jgi:hypothetical protein
LSSRKRDRSSQRHIERISNPGEFLDTQEGEGQDEDLTESIDLSIKMSRVGLTKNDFVAEGASIYAVNDDRYKLYP